MNEDRDQTDQSLREERVKTDNELERLEKLIRREADAAVVEARETADAVAGDARQLEDRKLAMQGAPAIALRAVEESRGHAAYVLGVERRQGDLALHEERTALQQAVAEVLGLERENTDHALLRERMGQLQEVQNHEFALEDLKGRLRTQKETVEDALHARDVFLSMAAHELRTPLTALQLQVQRLRREAGEGVGWVPPTVLRRIAITEEQVKRMEELVRRLLEVSDPAGPKPQRPADQVDLGLLARRVANQMRAAATRAECELVDEISLLIHGTWNCAQLEQVVQNLLANAIKFGAGAPVTVRLAQVGSAARLQVQDQGIGIKAEVLPRLFRRFERGASERHYGGLGLGLSQTRELVEGMGGSISVQSEEGHGATFTVDLPLP